MNGTARGHAGRVGSHRRRRYRPEVERAEARFSAGDLLGGMIGAAMLADLLGRATRATHEVQPAAGFTRDVPPTFPAGHRPQQHADATTAS